MENDIPLELLAKHPTIKCLRQDQSVIYYGNIIINADMYEITVKQTNMNGVDKFELINRNEKLKDYEKYFISLGEDSSISNVTTYINRLESIIRKYSIFPKNYCSVYRKILSEYSEFTKFFIDLKICTLSSDLTSIKASSCDDKGREHPVEIGIDYSEPTDIFFLKEYNVPRSRNQILNKKSCSLLDLYNVFLGYMTRLQPYFDLLDVIDSNSLVIDPKDKQYRSNYRRICLAENVTVIITIDPVNINSCPQFAFVGPDRLINEFRSNLNENIMNWDNNGDIFMEILKLLGINEFPMKMSDSLELQHQSIELLKGDSDCSICFCSNLEGLLPEIVCNNKCCENYYHKSCLYEWLLSINSKKVFSEIQGPCPNCEKMISCPIPC